MYIRIPKGIIYDFAEKILREANVDAETIDADLDAFIYESFRYDEVYTDDDGDEFYIIKDYDFSY
jgi:hypothetical protein